MKTLRNILIISIAILLFAVGCGFNFYQKNQSLKIENSTQYTIINKQNSEIKGKKITIEILTEKLDNCYKRISELEIQLKKVTQENTQFKSIIASLKNKIQILEAIKGEKENELVDIKEQYANSQNDVRGLQKSINEYELDIENLNEEQERLSSALSKSDEEISIINEEKKRLNEDLKVQKDVQLVLKGTQINLRDFNLNNERGMQVANIKKGWHQSHFEFTLYNANPALLKNKNFALEIYDIDNGISLKLQNPLEGESDISKSFLVQSDDNIFKIGLNHEETPIRGKNFCLRLYYIPDINNPSIHHLCAQSKNFVANKNAIVLTKA